MEMIISDTLMPEMDGFQLCREIRKSSKFRNIPFIFYSGTYTEKKDRDLALGMGADRFILKPVEPDEMIKVINSVIEEAATGKREVRKSIAADREDTFKLYSERLINKLEDKMLALEKEINRRQEVEENLRKSELYYRSLLQNLHEDILLVDRDYRITDVNNSVLLTSGRKREDVLGQHCYEIFHGYNEPCHNLGVDCMLAEVFKTNSPRNIHHEHLRLDGSKIKVDVLHSPLRDENGNITHVIQAIRDVSELYKAMRTSHEIALDLSKRVKELNCLYGVSKLAARPSVSLSEILLGTANLMPPAWQSPEIAGARIVYETNEYKTENFKSTKWMQTKELKIKGIASGTIEVCYLEDMPEADEGPFLGEERRLINAVADELGLIIERYKAEKKLQQSYEKIQKALKGSINAMASIVEKRDPYTAGHQRRVSQLSAAIAQKLELPDERIQEITMAAFVHDIGKIDIPAEILSKPTKLTEVEFELLKKHPRGAYEILTKINFPQIIADIVLQHHERVDGSGYPHGISGDQFTLEARILSVADTVEAMASPRPYRPALGVNKALKEVNAFKGIFFDPEIVEICEELLKSGEFKFEY